MFTKYSEIQSPFLWSLKKKQVCGARLLNLKVRRFSLWEPWVQTLYTLTSADLALNLKT